MPEKNPIHQAALPSIAKAKNEVLNMGQSDNAIFLSALDYAIKDPKGLRKFLHELEAIRS